MGTPTNQRSSSRDALWQRDGIKRLDLPAGMAQISMRGGQTLNNPMPGDDVELYTDDGKGKGIWVGGFTALSGLQEGDLGGPYDNEDVVIVCKAEDYTEGSMNGAEWPAKYLRIARGEKPAFRKPTSEPEKPAEPRTTAEAGFTLRERDDATVEAVALFFREDQRRGYHGRWVDEGTIHPEHLVEAAVPHGGPDEIRAAESYMQARGVTRESTKARMIELVTAASKEDYNAGYIWYQKAHDFCAAEARKWGVSTWRLVAATSAVSPLTEWDHAYPEINSKPHPNLNQGKAMRLAQIVYDPKWYLREYEIDENYANQFEIKQVEEAQAKNDEKIAKGEKPTAHKILSLKSYNGSDPAFAPGTDLRGRHTLEELPADIVVALERPFLAQMPNNAAKAIRALRGEDPASVLGGTGKTRSFYNNMLNPNDPDFVTIDTHMVRAITNNLGLTEKQQGELVKDGNNYKIMHDGILDAARELGLLPQQVQAIVWTHWKTIHEASDRAADTKAKAKAKRGAS